MEDSLLDAMREAQAPFVVELQVKAADGKPAAVRCCSLTTAELMASMSGKFGGVPQLVGASPHKREISERQKREYYEYLRLLTKRSVIAYRAVDKTDLSEKWLKVEWIDEKDGKTPRVEGDVMYTHIDDWDRGPHKFVAQIGNRVLRESNLGGPLAAFAAVEFRSERLPVDGEDSEGIRDPATRGADVEA